MDIFEFNAGFDLTFDNFYVVAAVEPLALGGGYYDSDKLGLDGRMFGRWHETRTEADFLFDCLIGYEKQPQRGNRYLFDGMYKPMTSFRHDDGQPFRSWGLTQRLFDREHYPFDATAEIYLFFFGVDLGLSPIELLDFVAGIFTIDAFCDDDYVNPMGWDSSGTGMGTSSDASEVAIILPGITRTRGIPSDAFDLDDISTAPPRPGFLITLEHVPVAPDGREPEKISLTAPAPPMTAPPQDEDEEIVVTLESVPKEEQEDKPEKAPKKPQEKTTQKAKDSNEGMMVITLESVSGSDQKKKPAEKADAPPVKTPNKKAVEISPRKTEPGKKNETKPATAAGASPADPGAADAATVDDGAILFTLESVEPTPKETPTPVAEKPTLPKRGKPAASATVRPSTASKNPTPMVPREMMDDYKKMFGSTDFHKPEELFKLANWCAEKGLERKSIWHLRQTIALDPIHAEARRMLGYVRYGRMWVRAKPVDLTARQGD